MLLFLPFFLFFFFNDTATTEIYTLSLHDALPILISGFTYQPGQKYAEWRPGDKVAAYGLDRKSTRLNSSHSSISYAVFCLKKKKKKKYSKSKKKKILNAYTLLFHICDPKL